MQEKGIEKRWSTANKYKAWTNSKSNQEPTIKVVHSLGKTKSKDDNNAKKGEKKDDPLQSNTKHEHSKSRQD